MALIHIGNWIKGLERPARSGNWLEKHNPHDGTVLSHVADSGPEDVSEAVSAASEAFGSWSSQTPVSRGQMLGNLVTAMKGEAESLAHCVATETGKPPGDARGEVGAALLQGEFFAGEGTRLYGRSLTSGMIGKQSVTLRQPHGVAALIVPANTPIANIAWKIFPALICGNTVVLKASEDSPEIALRIARLAQAAGLPDGVLNVIQGAGRLAGAALVEEERVSIISFTGSTAVGRWIAETAGRRLVRVSLELGGKNPFVVCDDADLKKAVHWAALSAFSNAGQRCASGSRILVFKNVYQEFKTALVEHAKALRLGVDESAHLGPVMNARQHQCILGALRAAEARGARILCGGTAATEPELQAGYYVRPTIVEGIGTSDELDAEELFGPVASITAVANLEEALARANSSRYGLTSAIHTRSIDRAMWFAQRVRTGVANINLGTFGSEPHMPFGGFGLSGNGTREPGVEALDVYSELKNLSWLVRDDQL